VKKDDYNLEFFKYIREEINKRVDIHYKLLLSKVALAGAMFAFLIGQAKTIPVSPYLITAIFAFLIDIVVLENLGWIRKAGVYIFAFLIDIVVLENLGWIRKAGVYIKQNIENTELNILRWETDFTQASSAWTCFSPTGYIIGVWAIAPALLLAAFVFDYDPSNKVQMFLFAMGLYQAAYTLYLIFKNLGANMSALINQSPSPIVHGEESA
jgi:hypothetical protein